MLLLLLRVLLRHLPLLMLRLLLLLVRCLPQALAGLMVRLLAGGLRMHASSPSAAWRHRIRSRLSIALPAFACGIPSCRN